MTAREAQLRHHHALEIDMIQKDYQQKIAEQLIEITDLKQKLADIRMS